MDNSSLAHTKWNCKYHIAFTPKYRRQIIYKQISADIGQIIRTLCARKGIEIIEAAAMRVLPVHPQRNGETSSGCWRTVERERSIRFL